MQFSKSAGLRLTDIRLDSRDNTVILGNGRDYHTPNQSTKTENIFKLVSLFPNQTLNIKNCILEIDFRIWNGFLKIFNI